MGRLFSYPLLVTSATLLTACAHDAPEVVIASPALGVQIVGQTSKGEGPLAGNFSEISAVYQRGEKSDRQLVLSGLYLTVERIEWSNPHEATICLRAGYTSRFSNNVTLQTGERESYDIHFALREDCVLAMSADQRTQKIAP